MGARRNDDFWNFFLTILLSGVTAIITYILLDNYFTAHPDPYISVDDFDDDDDEDEYQDEDIFAEE